MALISVRNPESGEKTYLTANASASDGTLTVKNTTDYATNDYLLINGYGNEDSEIVSITSVDSTTQFTVSSLSFAHSVDTLVEKLNFNQVQWASASTKTETKTTVGSNITIDASDAVTESNLASITSGFIFARYYSVANDSYSSWSPAIAVSGFTENSLRYIIDQSRLRTSEQTEDLITDEDLLDIAKEASDEIETIRKNWSFVQSENDTQLTAARTSYYKPTDLAGPDSIERLFLTYDNRELDYYDSKDYWYKMQSIPRTTLTAQITSGSTTLNVVDTGAYGTTGTLTISADSGISYTGKTNKTFTGVTGVSATHTSNAEIFRTSDLDQPTAYSWWSDHILYYPPPDKFYNAHMRYYSTIGRMTDVTIETVVPFPALYVWKLMSEIFRMKRNFRRADFYEKKYQGGMKLLARKNRTKQTIHMRQDTSYIRKSRGGDSDMYYWKVHGSS